MTELTNRIVRNLAFTPEGIAIEYADVKYDLRDNGLASHHALLIPATDDYADLLDEVVEVVHRALNKALADWNNTVPMDDLPSELDNEPSPYDNPNDVARWQQRNDDSN